VSLRSRLQRLERLAAVPSAAALSGAMDRIEALSNDELNKLLARRQTVRDPAMRHVLDTLAELGELSDEELLRIAGAPAEEARPPSAGPDVAGDAPFD
jgi:hypothetical protein